MPDTTTPAAADPFEFGPLDRDVWEEQMACYPENSGLVPCIAPVAVAAGVIEWQAELRRGTPHGPDLVDCGQWGSQRLAWAACVSRALVMCWHALAGEREKAESFFTTRAPRPAAAEAAARS